MTDVRTNIPLVDLRAQYRNIQVEIGEAINRVLERADFILGEELRLFEDDFANYCGTKFAVGCGSGTDALHLACRALGIGVGDEVIIPAFTFVATALGISLSGATPVLVDVDPETALIDPEQVGSAITARTRAIMPVHLYGQCVDLQPLTDLAVKHNLFLIEDAAQAHGARQGNHLAGSFGNIGCFSFYPGKNLGAYGDAGIITVDDEQIADKLRLLRNWGSRKKYHHDEQGFNSRLDTIQAAILRVKLRYLDQWNIARKEFAAEYFRALGNINEIHLLKPQGDSVFHLFVVRVDNRENVRNRLHESVNGAGIHYPFAIHELGAYHGLGYVPGAFPVAETWARHCLSLPIYAEMPREAITRTADILSVESSSTSY